MEERCYVIMKKLSANQGGGDDANIIFGKVNIRMFRIGYTT